MVLARAAGYLSSWTSSPANTQLSQDERVVTVPPPPEKDSHTSLQRPPETTDITTLVMERPSEEVDHAVDFDPDGARPPYPHVSLAKPSDKLTTSQGIDNWTGNACGRLGRHNGRHADAFS